MNRRRFISGAAAAGAAGLAGCGTAAGAVRAPNVPVARLEEGGWEQVDGRTEQLFSHSVAGVDVTATAVTRVYDDAALRADVADRTLGALDAPLAQFFASRVAFSPNLAEVPLESAREELAARASSVAGDTFEASLREAGLTDVTASDGGTLSVATGEDATCTDYAAAFPFDSFSFDVRGETLTVEGGRVAVEGLLAAWVHDGGLLVAGGAYPAENFARVLERQLSEGITVSVSIDLGLTPDRYAAELEGLVTRIE